MTNLCYDKSKPGRKDDQWVLLKMKPNSKLKDIVNDVPMQDAAKNGDNEFSTAQAYAPGDDIWGDQDADMCD
eukprot:2968091-Karenia_brevis.AAC.1